MATPEQNKAVVLDYYRTAFAGDPERAVREHFGPVYIQHNPQAADGPEAFINFVHSLRAENPASPSTSSEPSPRTTWSQPTPA